MEQTKAESQVTHSLRDSAGRPLQSGSTYTLHCPHHKPVKVKVSEDELNFDLWFLPVGNPTASPQRVDSLAADVELVLAE